MSSFITHVLTRSRDRKGAVNKVRETIYRSLTVAAPFVVFTSGRGAGACAAGLLEGQRL